MGKTRIYLIQQTNLAQKEYSSNTYSLFGNSHTSTESRYSLKLLWEDEYYNFHFTINTLCPCSGRQGNQSEREGN